jgi:predicted HicB family RNase H-like nuclease
MRVRSAPDLKMTRGVLVKFSQQEHRRLVAAAQQRGLRVTDFARTAIRQAVSSLAAEPRSEPR